jgi:hypothetical protein
MMQEHREKRIESHAMQRHCAVCQQNQTRLRSEDGFEVANPSFGGFASGILIANITIASSSVGTGLFRGYRGIVLFVMRVFRGEKPRSFIYHRIVSSVVVQFRPA